MEKGWKFPKLPNKFIKNLNNHAYKIFKKKKKTFLVLVPTINQFSKLL